LDLSVKGPCAGDSVQLDQTRPFSHTQRKSQLVIGTKRCVTNQSA